MLRYSESRPLGVSRAEWVEAEKVAAFLRGDLGAWWLERFDEYGRLVERKVAQLGYQLEEPVHGHYEYGWLTPPKAAEHLRDHIWRLPKNGVEAAR